MFFARFWGVRGSIACPRNNTLKFGGNTSCIEIRTDKHIVIVDAGTGIYTLGQYLLAHDLKERSIDADLFVTHTHSDHISGFPMFPPLFFPATKLRIRGPVMPGKISLEKAFSDYMSYAYWPVRLDELPSSITFTQLGETTIDLDGGLVCKSTYLNHPIVCLGYRFEYQGKSIVTAFDTEPYWNIFREGEDGDSFFEDARFYGEEAAASENKRLLEFYKNADILIYDSQYTEEEYTPGRYHWGHSTYKSSVETANQAGVKKLVLYHHDPQHTDDFLEEQEKHCKEHYNPGKGMEIIMSKEGMVIDA
ncbi:MAG: MBL fold metallo-hydrolase [Spirochaetaceae bacterium]|jgi:phosphoribosyl 1,2-cyclic phosphodiesterase|nr:MBL fold metallo-hydrolase [Spirochaetaceae bacterium]